jgi:hypothetical protein
MRCQHRRFEPRCVTRSARTAQAPDRFAGDGAMSNTYALVRSSRQSVGTTVPPSAWPHIAPFWSCTAFNTIRIGGYEPRVSSGERRNPRDERSPRAARSPDDPLADPAALIRSSPRAASTTNTTKIAARSATVPRRDGGASRPRRIDADPVILAISSSASGSTAYTERSEDSTERAEPCAVAGAWVAHHGMSRIRPATGTRWTASARLPLPSARHAEQTRPSRAGYPVCAR